MARREACPRLEVRETFEPTRLSPHCLISALCPPGPDPTSEHGQGQAQPAGTSGRAGPQRRR
jgi:hypothetical protein